MKRTIIETFLWWIQGIITRWPSAEKVWNRGGTMEEYHAVRIPFTNLWIEEFLNSDGFDVVRTTSTTVVMSHALWCVMENYGYSIAHKCKGSWNTIDHLSSDEQTLLDNHRKEAEEKRKRLMQPQPEFSDLGDPEVTLPEGYEEVNFA